MGKRWVLADVESTGLKSATDKIVELAWMEINDGFDIVRQDASLIDPQCPIPAVTSAVHGITNRDVVGAPTIDEYMTSIDNYLGYGPMVLIAHNAAFDYGFLARFLPEDVRLLCTVRLARKLWPQMDNHKLGTLVYALELEVDKDRFHSADGDMAVLLALLGRAHEEFGLSLDDMLEMVDAPEVITVMPFGKHKGQELAKLPRNYVTWLLGLENLDRDLRTALQML